MGSLDAVASPSRRSTRRTRTTASSATSMWSSRRLATRLTRRSRSATYDAGDDMQGFFWDAATGRSPEAIATRSTASRSISRGLVDKLGRAVPTNDCRKIYMVFAPRFERTEEELEDGCFLTAGVGAVRHHLERGRCLEAHGRAVLRGRRRQRGARRSWLGASRRRSASCAGTRPRRAGAGRRARA